MELFPGVDAADKTCLLVMGTRRNTGPNHRSSSDWFLKPKRKKNKNKKPGTRKKEPEMRKTNNGENQMKQQEGDRMRR